MPCDQIITTHVKFLEKSTDVKLLKLALESMGFTVSVTKTGLSFQRGYREFGTYVAATGKLTLPLNVTSDEVKVAYSKEVVKDTAKRSGWNMDDNWDVDAEGNPEVEVSKRGW